ncbi:hypothetical protein KXD40_002927 [Peronospora effusa]|uniref:Uncharacterized protein n=1 Tax=Peronospora effusa TaxID=542832 RepID=A0A3M6VIS9_9STRA|nr:hypothetical protein DD238_005829 [Peronospora effusa]RQM14742.1 hypothetical protein DD237_002204 [Peronospora effusa]UIZ29232.1 hypothetical protein KXD40_002927 [Peronospora effusa]
MDWVISCHAAPPIKLIRYRFARQQVNNVIDYYGSDRAGGFLSNLDDVADCDEGADMAKVVQGNCHLHLN